MKMLSISKQFLPISLLSAHPLFDPGHQIILIGEGHCLAFSNVFVHDPSHIRVIWIHVDG